MRRIQHWVLAGVLWGTFLSPGLACMCGGDTDDMKNYNLEDFEVIFLGELSSATYFPSININTTVSFPAEVDSFTILKVWKGNIHRSQELAIYQFGLGCTNPLTDKVRKSRFIVAAYRQKSDMTAEIGAFLQANLCSPIIYEKDSIAFQDATRFLDSIFVVVSTEAPEEHVPKSNTWIHWIFVFSIIVIITAWIRKMR